MCFRTGTLGGSVTSFCGAPGDTGSWPRLEETSWYRPRRRPSLRLSRYADYSYIHHLPASVPAPLHLLCLLRQVVCGQNCTFVIQPNGTVLACGEGSYGRLGQGNSDDLHVLTVISALQGAALISDAESVCVFESQSPLMAATPNRLESLFESDRFKFLHLRSRETFL